MYAVKEGKAQIEHAVVLNEPGWEGVAGGDEDLPGLGGKDCRLRTAASSDELAIHCTRHARSAAPQTIPAATAGK